ncbi:hypothetical protein GW17_00042906 [Ensete ventricosum]|nr:hypothetical protein GW17_00042906 [Ensete ventricosum]
MVGRCCPRAAAATGWRRRLARPPGPQAHPRVLCPQATTAAGGCRITGHRAAGEGALAATDRHCRGPGRGPLPLSSLPSLRKFSKNT